MTEESTSQPSEPESDLSPSTYQSGDRRPAQLPDAGLDPASSRDRLPDIVLPEPSRMARVMMMLRSAGIFFGGVGLFIASLVIRDLYHENQQNNAEAKCRAEIMDELTAQESKINATGWTAMLAAFRDEDQAVDLHATELESLLTDLPELRDRAANRFELCAE